MNIENNILGVKLILIQDSIDYQSVNIIPLNDLHDVKKMKDKNMSIITKIILKKTSRL